MKILFISDNFSPETNAAASRVYERACYWVKWGHDATVITCAPNFPEGKLFKGYKNKFYQVEYIDGIRVIRVKTFIAQNKGFLLRILDMISFTFPAFLAGLFQKRPDVIVATTPSLFAAIAALFVSKIRKIPFVLEISDLWPASIVGVGAMRDSMVIRWLEKLERFLCRNASEIIILSPAFKNHILTKNISDKKISVVINGVELSKYSPREKNITLGNKYNIDTNSFIVGYIGTHGMAHALENVLHAAELLKNNTCIRFLFVGAGAAKDTLVEMAKMKNLHNAIFVPAQSKELIAEFWSLCDVALVHLKNSPVFSEVIPSKIFEAMGMGKPILMASPLGIATSIIEENNIGMVVQPEDPVMLADMVLRFYNDRDLTSKMAATSYQVAPHYSREHQARLMLQILEYANGYVK